MQPLLALASIAQSVVLITSGTQAGAKTGTGFAISSTGNTTRILTANHVVDGVGVPIVFIGGPRGAHFEATVVNTDRLRDIALLEVPTTSIPTAPLGPQSPPTGTSVQALGYPTEAQPTAAQPTATPYALPMDRLQLITYTGKVDGEAEQGESVLLQLPLTHGDSGGPIVDAKSGQVVGMVLGLAGGYGVARWMSGDGLGLSAQAITAFLQQSGPSQTPPSPSFHVALKTASGDDPITDAWSQLAQSAGFIRAVGGGHDACHTPSGVPIADAVIEEDVEDSVLSIEATDCSGATFYSGDAFVDNGLPDALRLLHRSFLGFLDTHHAEWESLVRFGLAVNPKRDPYVSLMSVERNPFVDPTLGPNLGEIANPPEQAVRDPRCAARPAGDHLRAGLIDVHFQQLG